MLDIDDSNSKKLMIISNFFRHNGNTFKAARSLSADKERYVACCADYVFQKMLYFSGIFTNFKTQYLETPHLATLFFSSRSRIIFKHMDGGRLSKIKCTPVHGIYNCKYLKNFGLRFTCQFDWCQKLFDSRLDFR